MKMLHRKFVEKYLPILTQDMEAKVFILQIYQSHFCNVKRFTNCIYINDSFAFTSDSCTTSCNKTIHWCSLTVHDNFVLKRCLVDVLQLAYSSTNTAILEIWEDFLTL